MSREMSNQLNGNTALAPLICFVCPASVNRLKALLQKRKLVRKDWLGSSEGAAMPKEITFDQALARAKRMSERYVEKGSYVFFPLTDIVDEVQRGLAKNLVEHGRLFCP